MSAPAELWNTTDVAQYLGVKPGTVSAYRHRGQMPEPDQTIGSRTHLWNAQTIRDWSAHRTIGRRQTSDQPMRERTDPAEWLPHGERDLYTNEWVTLSLVDVETPDGTRFEHHVVTMKPAVIVALVSDDGEHVGMVWRHRFAPAVWGWEFPGGLIDGDEAPEETAARELAEEQGLTGGKLRHLVTFEPAVGMVRNAHHVFVATGCKVTQEATEQNEGGAFEWLPLASMRERIDAGEISNSASLIAITYLLAFGTD